jgi:flagellar hook assembly protein FlgD
LKVYNEIGQEVATLVTGRQNAGTYTARWDGRNIASGVYYYRLAIDGESPIVKKAALVK